MPKIFLPLRPLSALKSWKRLGEKRSTVTWSSYIIQCRAAVWLSAVPPFNNVQQNADIELLFCYLFVPDPVTSLKSQFSTSMDSKYCSGCARDLPLSSFLAGDGLGDRIFATCTRRLSQRCACRPRTRTEAVEAEKKTAQSWGWGIEGW